MNMEWSKRLYKVNSEGASKGDYYFMPQNVPMSASNLSGSDMTLLDLFITDSSTAPITILEPGYPGYKNPIAWLRKIYLSIIWGSM